MFVILATKPLNDGTKGFRFNFFGKTTIYTEQSTNKTTARKFHHVAG